jgi:hypothetical protein
VTAAVPGLARADAGTSRTVGFSVRGRLDDGREVAVSWTNGRLDGDAETVRRVRHVLEQSTTLQLSPQDTERTADEGDEHGVMAAIQEVLAITGVEGDYPITGPDDSAS